MQSLKNSVTLALLMFLAAGLLSACSDNEQDAMNQKASSSAEAETLPPSLRDHLTVYKSPSCGCCGEWVEHIEAAGLQSSTEHPEDLSSIKTKLGVPENLRSCHTAVSRQGYVFEGHIPARYIKRFLDNPPSDSIGLTVPGMPVGSPGMEVDDKFMPYQILSLQADGSIAVYANIDSPAMQ